jgi:hypothetical protein
MFMLQIKLDENLGERGASTRSSFTSARDSTMKSEPTGFWSGGRRQYLRALRDAEEEKIAPLQQALKSDTDPEIKRSLKDQIRRIRAEFQGKRKAADSSLFANT